MTSEFAVYLELGFRHIADIAAWDHILFIVALSAGYALTHWRQLLVLVTAFTIGHSITLALATLRLVSISSYLVEVLIPVTIMVTGIFNVVEIRLAPREADPPPAARRVKYALALIFGLIHGLGFSTFLRAVLGGEESIALPLFSFNVGLEVGQIVILSAILVVGYGATRGMGVKSTLLALLLSCTTTVAALVMLVGRVAGPG